MRIVHITPHLPPDQAANALLPFQLGEWARARGDQVTFISHPPMQKDAAPVAAGIVTVPRTRRGVLQRLLRTGSLAGAWRIRRDATAAIAAADIVHVHSNGLLPEVAAAIAVKAGRPVVLTLYGTEIWHYRPKRLGPDLFTRSYRTASAVTFYSRRLLERAGSSAWNGPDCTSSIPPSPKPSVTTTSKRSAANGPHWALRPGTSW